MSATVLSYPHQDNTAEKLEKTGERIPTPEEQAEAEAKAKEWVEKVVGADALEEYAPASDDTFISAMSAEDVPPFAGDAPAATSTEIIQFPGQTQTPEVPPSATGAAAAVVAGAIIGATEVAQTPNPQANQEGQPLSGTPTYTESVARDQLDHGIANASEVHRTSGGAITNEGVKNDGKTSEQRSKEAIQNVYKQGDAKAIEDATALALVTAAGAKAATEEAVKGGKTNLSDVEAELDRAEDIARVLPASINIETDDQSDQAKEIEKARVSALGAYDSVTRTIDELRGATEAIKRNEADIAEKQAAEAASGTGINVAETSGDDSTEQMGQNITRMDADAINRFYEEKARKEEQEKKKAAEAAAQQHDIPGEKLEHAA